MSKTRERLLAEAIELLDRPPNNRRGGVVYTILIAWLEQGKVEMLHTFLLSAAKQEASLHPVDETLKE